jgi:hypothetical protein
MANQIQYTLIPNEDAEKEQEIEKFGYKQTLERTLGLFSTFGLAFSYISPVVGVFWNSLTTLGLYYVRFRSCNWWSFVYLGASVRLKFLWIININQWFLVN